jgi:hypothetical protein
MKSLLSLLLFAILTSATTTHVHAQSSLLSAGVACRPASAADDNRVIYYDGSARSVFSAPGTSDQIATVVCQLPSVPPGSVMTAASVTYYDTSSRWDKCYFQNVYPGLPAHSALVTGVTGRPWIGVATLAVDATSFVPHSVRCMVKPGQSLYAVSIDVAPL